MSRLQAGARWQAPVPRRRSAPATNKVLPGTLAILELSPWHAIAR